MISQYFKEHLVMLPSAWLSQERLRRSAIFDLDLKILLQSFKVCFGQLSCGSMNPSSHRWNSLLLKNGVVFCQVVVDSVQVQNSRLGKTAQDLIIPTSMLQPPSPAPSSVLSTSVTSAVYTFFSHPASEISFFF